MPTCLSREIGRLKTVLELTDALTDVVTCASFFEQVNYVVGDLLRVMCIGCHYDC
jgi:hypothetical protein